MKTQFLTSRKMKSKAQLSINLARESNYPFNERSAITKSMKGNTKIYFEEELINRSFVRNLYKYAQ